MFLLVKNFEKLYKTTEYWLLNYIIQQEKSKMSLVLFLIINILNCSCNSNIQWFPFSDFRLVRFSDISTIVGCRLFNAKSIFMQKTVLFQSIQFSISTQLNSIWPIDRTLSGVTTPSQSGPWDDCNKGLLRILPKSSITGTSPSDSLVSYLGHTLGKSYPAA